MFDGLSGMDWMFIAAALALGFGVVKFVLVAKPGQKAAVPSVLPDTQSTPVMQAGPGAVSGVVEKQVPAEGQSELSCIDMAADPVAVTVQSPGRAMKRIHLIDKAHDVYQMTGHMPGTTVPGVFMTTRWRMTAEAAKSCIGAEVHLHEAQKLPAFQAGRCTGFFPLDNGFGLVFVDDGSIAAGRVQTEHWGHEQARVPV